MLISLGQVLPVAALPSTPSTHGNVWSATTACKNRRGYQSNSVEVDYVIRDCGAKVLVDSRDKVAAALATGAACVTSGVFGQQPVPGAKTSTGKIMRRELKKLDS